MRNSSTSPDSMTIPSLIQSKDRLWKEIENLEHSGVLKLAILRDLILALHSEKSRLLATQNRDGAKDLALWEQKIEFLIHQPKLNGDLIPLIQQAKLTRSATPAKLEVPAPLLTVFPKEKILREDRKCEAAILLKSYDQGWGFWCLEAWVEVSKIETWTQSLTQLLWPHGILVFAESAPPTTLNKAGPSLGLWNGHWWLTISPDWNPKHELLNALPSWPGTPKTAPTDSSLKHIFPNSKA